MRLDESPSPIDILVFEIGGRRFALPAPVVREVHRAVAILPLPNAPPLVEGVIDVHGEIVPVLDVRARAGLSAAPVSLTDHLILVSTHERTVAIRADCATELVRVDSADVARLRGVAAPGDERPGVVRLPDGLLLIEDLERFLDADGSRALDLALRAGSDDRSANG
jgi:purine-binding chemotaxis protein CheW